MSDNAAAAREEKQLLDRLFESDLYKEYSQFLKDQREEAIARMISRPPSTFGDFVEREQAIGAVAYVDEITSWFDSRRQACEDIIAEHTTTHDNQ